MSADLCHTSGCNRPARMAFRITRPTRADLRVLVYADDRVAPKTATRMCREHGIADVAGILQAVVHTDEP